MNKEKSPVAPGELLYKKFMLPNGITKYRLAKEINVPAQRIGDIVAGKRAITVDTDVRLSRYFGVSRGYWLHTQALYDTQLAEDTLADQLAAITPLAGAL